MIPMETRSELSKKYIAEALIQLMKKKDFTSITNKDITDRAGFSHITYYRNFSNKEDIIKYYLKHIFDEWKQEWEDDENIAYQLFRFFTHHKDIIELLYKANLQFLLIDHILQLHDYDRSDPSPLAYAKVTVAYLIFGWCDEWYKRGMIETPEEMAAYFNQQSKEHER